MIKRIIFHRYVAFLHDFLWIPVAIYFSYWVRFNFDGIPEENLKSLYKLLIFAPPVQGLLFWIFGLYRGIWRFASIQDLIRILKSVGIGALFITGSFGMMTHFHGVPRSIFFLYPIFLTAGLSMPRLLWRYIKERQIKIVADDRRRVLVFGAGRAGELIVRDLLYRSNEYNPVAILDDDPVKIDREIHGVRVLGGSDKIPEIVERLKIELVILAIPSARKEVMQRLVSICQKINVECKTLPALLEMRGQEVNFEKLRSISVNDLLGRDSVRLDIKAISDYLKGRIVLVTGGGGSIGSELCRQVALHNPEMLIIFDHGEFNLYSIEQELSANAKELCLETVLGDVRNSAQVEWLFSKYRPNVVFHAAAYKHVPMVEYNQTEGISNNVFGTINIANAADKYGAEKFVLVSTDKAVNPVNVMGATKRVAEIYCQNLDKHSNTSFITVRFGNVLGSTGSVVPLFQEQIKRGGPVTVTHPEITRYFMTIPEAAGLTMQAGAIGKGGEIFVLDMGEPVLIKKLAEHMIKLCGLEPGKDIEIVYTGLRPGEKLYEELLHSSEKLLTTTHEKLLLACCRGQVDWNWLNDQLEILRNAVNEHDYEEIYRRLKIIVPEFKHEMLDDTVEPIEVNCLNG